MSLIAMPDGKPKLILQFVGAFLFGSAPQSYYGSLVRALVKKGYAVVLHRFPCNPLQFDHWEVTFRLLKEQNARQHLLKELHADAPSAWLGHSLGCKFIILMEILSNESSRRDAILRKFLPSTVANDLIKRASSIFPERERSYSFIYNQPSLFMAPEISNTFRLFRSGSQINNGQAKPTMQQTMDMINASTDLFNLTRVISFNQDLIAEDDVDFMAHQLRNRGILDPVVKTEGGHFKPLSIDLQHLADKIESALCSLSQVDPSNRDAIAAT